MASTSSPLSSECVENPEHCVEQPKVENERHDGDPHPVCEPGELPHIATDMMARIGTCLGSMEAQMGNTNRLLEQMVNEMRAMREQAKEAQISTSRSDKLLLAEQSRTNDLIEKALYAEPSANLFANSKDRHPHKTYLRVIAEDLDTLKRKLR